MGLGTCGTCAYQSMGGKRTKKASQLVKRVSSGIFPTNPDRRTSTVRDACGVQTRQEREIPLNS